MGWGLPPTYVVFRENTMKKRIFSILLTLALLLGTAVFTAIPASAVVHNYGIYVGGIQVNEDNAADVLEDGTVSYDPATNTLTLNNATITECFTEEFFGEDTYFGIYCEANEFNLQLVGENTIYLSEGKDNDNYYAVYSSGAMNVGGNGSLSVTSFGGIAAMGNLTVKDCSLDFSGTGVVSMGKVSFENVTIEAFAAVMAYSDVTVKDSTMVAGTTVVALEETGSLLIEDSAITVANGQYGTSIEVTSGNVTIKNSTLNLNVNAVEEESAMGILAGNQLTLENVQANIELRTKAGYALMGMAKVTIKQSNLTISAVSLEDSAIGINSSGNITIEESLLEIDVRGGDDLSAGIGTMNGKVEIKDSTLKLTTSGNSVVGILGVNIDLINCDGFVEVMATGEGELMGAGLGTIDGTLTINGGVLNIEATGSVDSDAFGILIEGATPPTFIDANITIRGSGAASIYAPNLNSYGREYAIEASEDIDCDTPVEYNPENIHDYKYLYIHGWYTVTFNANGGTGTMDAVENLYGVFTIPENGFTAPEGKQFKGWAYAADGEIISETGFDVHKDTILYAIWEDISGGGGEDNLNGNDTNHTHSYGDDWKQTTDEHYKECACGAKQYKGAHIDSNANGSCDVCGYVITESNDGALGAGAIIGIVIGSVAVVGIGGFALFWFVIKKKSFADLIAIFKK